MKKTKRQVEDDSALNIQATQFTTTSAICTQNPYQKIKIILSLSEWPNPVQ